MGAPVPEDRRVETACESLAANIGQGANPIIINGLVCIQNKGIALSRKYLNRVDGKRHCIDAIDFNDGLFPKASQEKIHPD